MASTQFFNDELKTIIQAGDDGEIRFFHESTESPEAPWSLDESGNDKYTAQIGLRSKGMHLLENHISPDASFILICTQGLKIYELRKGGLKHQPKAVLRNTFWTLPLKMDDIEPLELARRVRFEAKNVIRVLT